MRIRDWSSDVCSSDLLGEQGVKTLYDLADLAADELRFACSSQRGEHSLEDMGKLTNSEVDRILQGSPMGQDEANAIIMAARAHWFEDEPAPAHEEAAHNPDEAPSTAPWHTAPRNPSQHGNQTQ